MDTETDGEAIGNAERGGAESEDSIFGGAGAWPNAGRPAGAKGDARELLGFVNAFPGAAPCPLNTDVPAVLKALVPNADTAGLVCCAGAPNAEGAPNADVAGAESVPNADVAETAGVPNVDVGAAGVPNAEVVEAAGVPNADVEGAAGVPNTDT